MTDYEDLERRYDVMENSSVSPNGYSLKVMVRQYRKLWLEATQWIPVAERLPVDRQAVAFIVGPDVRSFSPGTMLGGWYVAGEFGGFTIPGTGGIPATHWKPLGPEPQA